MAGLSVALIAMVPLLQTPQDNPHATLITLSKKGIADTITEKEREKCIDPNNGWAITANLYLMTPHIPPGHGPNHPRVFALGMACEALAEYDDILERCVPCSSLMLNGTDVQKIPCRRQGSRNGRVG